VKAVGRRGRHLAGRTDTRFPDALATWIAQDGELLDGLLALRRLGREGEEALEALLAVRRVATLKASWSLWSALAEGDGHEPEDLLLRALPLDAVERARQALWGRSWRDGDDSRPWSLRAHLVVAATC